MLLKPLPTPHPSVSPVGHHVIQHTGTASGGSIWAVDAPTWITAIATVGLLVGAYFTAKYAARAFRKQAEEVAALQDERVREAAERRRA